MTPKRTMRRRRRSSLSRRQRVPYEAPPEEAGRDEVAAFIAEMLASLVPMARRHRLDVLTYLMSMAQLEAEEHMRQRSGQKLS